MIFHLLLFDAREPERELEAFIELAVLDENSGFSSFLSACFRSEEHTSELQSRPHISYAVFCLKKKTKKKQRKKTVVDSTKKG